MAWYNVGSVARFWHRLGLDAHDAHTYGGLALVSFGVWSVWPPGAAIVFGLGLLFIAFR